MKSRAEAKSQKEKTMHAELHIQRQTKESAVAKSGSQSGAVDSRFQTHL